MPKLKQPATVQKMALEVLFQSVMYYLDQLSINGSLDELRQGVSIIKKHVCNYIPWYLLADFSTRFLDQFHSTERPASHCKAALEILMDIEIVGLRCKGRIVAHLDPKDGQRFQRLGELDLEYFPTTLPICLENFHLSDLTAFNFGKKCTDIDLNVIGRNCPQLQVLKVRRSNVTDEGLRALSLCTELRVVDIVDCPVSDSGINAFLSAHKKIERFAHWDGTGHEFGCDILTHLDASVLPSITHFVFENHRETRPVEIQAIVSKFPNLTDLKIACSITEGLTAVKSLNKLTGIAVHFKYAMFYNEIERTWDNVKELLTFIGSNLTTLKLFCFNQGFLWHQQELNFIFDSCPNIEHLEFDHGDGLIVIPSFPNLKELNPRIPINSESIEILDDPAIEFDKMSSLETLSLLDYIPNLKTIESIILDDNKFPVLSVIKTNCMKAEDLIEIERIAKNGNLDFKVINDPETNWYTEYRFSQSHDTDSDADEAP